MVLDIVHRNKGEHIVNDITNFCFRFLPKPYTETFAGSKTKFLMSLTIKKKKKRERMKNINDMVSKT